MQQSTSKKNRKIVTRYLSKGLIMSVLLAFSSCHPIATRSRQQLQRNDGLIETKKLEPTIKKTQLEKRSKEGLPFEKPQKKIKNGLAEIIVGHLKIDHSQINYNPQNNQIIISGVASVLDDSNKEIGSSTFNLSGQHKDDENVFYLNSDKATKAKSSEKPVVRAKITCLTLNADGDFDCSKAVIDFFAAYKKQIYTEQMEIAQTVEPNPEPTSTASSNNHNPNSTTTNTDDQQQEGEEESIDGRYQGQAETADLNQVFEDDEDKNDVIPTKNETSAQTAPTTQPQQTSAPTAPSTQIPPKNEPPKNSDNKTTTDKKDKLLSKDLLQTKSGDVRPINQAVGFPDSGRLRNATSLLDKQKLLSTNAHFEVSFPQRLKHYSTYEMAEMISRLGKHLYSNFNKKLYVSNISQKNGGKLPPHASHQIGLDVDLAYPSTSEDIKFPVVVQMSTRQYNSGSYSIPKTYQLLKNAFSQTDIKVDRVFIDRTIKKALCEYAKNQGEFNSKDKALVQTLFQSIDHVDGHGDHLHLRLKCSIYDPACRQKLYTVNKGCG